MTAIKITPLPAALGAVVEGVDADNIGPDEVATLVDAWDKHLVLFFPKLHLTSAQQVSMARHFGQRIAATTDSGSDYRGAPTLAEQGFPELLVLDTGLKHDPRTTSNWHTDVTFVDNPPKGSLFAMHIPAVSGGDTMWSSQIAAHRKISAPIQGLIAELTATHGRPPLTGTAQHPMVTHHHKTGEPVLYANRGWTTSVNGVAQIESVHLLAMLFERAERPELQVRWRWSAGDVALWDNRYTMHYAINDYARERRRATRATIYD